MPERVEVRKRHKSSNTYLCINTETPKPKWFRGIEWDFRVSEKSMLEKLAIVSFWFSEPMEGYEYWREVYDRIKFLNRKDRET